MRALVRRAIRSCASALNVVAAYRPCFQAFRLPLGAPGDIPPCSRGTHTADSASITVEKAGENWIARCRREQLEPSTVKSYEQHLNLHIVPVIGAKRLNHLTTPMVEDFRDYLLDHGRFARHGEAHSRFADRAHQGG